MHENARELHLAQNYNDEHSKLLCLKAIKTTKNIVANLN
jgi:hypothetical protein